MKTSVDTDNQTPHLSGDSQSNKNSYSVSINERDNDFIKKEKIEREEKKQK